VQAGFELFVACLNKIISSNVYFSFVPDSIASKLPFKKEATVSQRKIPVFSNTHFFHFFSFGDAQIA